MAKPTLADIVHNYKTALTPFIVRHPKKYRHNIRTLAAQLLASKRSSYARLRDAKQTDYVYVYLDVRKKKGRYVYTCPSGKQVIFSYPPYYVGKGKGYRSQAHLRDALKADLDLGSANRMKIGITRKILDSGRVPKILVIPTRLSPSVALAFEIDLIAGIGRRNLKTGPLTNLTDGGEGNVGFVHSPESRQKTSSSNAAVWAARTEKDRKVIGAKVSAGNKAAWATKTGADNKARQLKRAATEASRPQIECPHCKATSSRKGVMRAFHFDNCRFKGMSAEEIRIEKHGTPDERRELHRQRCIERAQYRPILICPHCLKKGKGPAMHKWHFNNCKKRN